MKNAISRRQLLERAAAGAAALTLPAILAACGGEGEGPASAGAGELPLSITVSNWPFYIDVDDETKKRPTLEAFTAATGIDVAYNEEINSNEEFFGKIQGALSQGQPIGRDVIVPTAWMAERLLKLEYLEKLDKSLIPNIVNLEDALAHPSWDPNRDYSLPWQTLITGIGYDAEKVPDEITSVDQLFDPSLKGKVTFLNSAEDTIGLILLSMGADPTKVDPAAFDEAIAKVRQAVNDGQIRQFTGNNYAPLLASGDVWAAVAWSGNLVQLQADNPSLKFMIPESGGMTFVDTMVIPKGGHVAGGSTFMNFYYDPKIMAQVEAFTNYVPPVKGTRKAMAAIDPTLVENELVFPDAETRARLYEYDAEALENVDFQQKWRALIGQ